MKGGGGGSETLVAMRRVCGRASWASLLAALSTAVSAGVLNVARPPEALVVSTVDGHVLTLDVWSGELRGEFTSGGPLVRSHVFTDGSESSDGGPENESFELDR
mmetsp:Transcript_72151/g.204964  ORF Transcript_72151/g.204964 Transcript_72151/m.204964 type:complete len:104 (-) Transcript_72151:2314-2625(-)